LSSSKPDGSGHLRLVVVRPGRRLLVEALGRDLVPCACSREPCSSSRFGRAAGDRARRNGGLEVRRVEQVVGPHLDDRVAPSFARSSGLRVARYPAQISAMPR
jgi:hypothetical protein